MENQIPVKVRKPLTERQQEIFQAVFEYIEANGFPPTLRELNNLTWGPQKKKVSLKAIYDQMNSMQKKGYIKMNGTARGISLPGYKVEVRRIEE